MCVCVCVSVLFLFILHIYYSMSSLLALDILPFKTVLLQDVNKIYKYKLMSQSQWEYSCCLLIT